MIQKIIDDNDCGDVFKRNFVVFTVSCLIRGNQSIKSNFKILLSLIKVNEIKNLNWCKYARRSLMDAGEEWQAQPTKMFTGPLLFLMICYFDRVQFKGQILDTLYPTIRIWSKERIEKRIKDERKLGFGLGKVIPRIMIADEEKEEREENEEANTEQNEDEEMISKEDCVKEIIVVAQKFSDAFVEFSKLPATISKRFPNSDILKKIYLTTADYFFRQANGSAKESEKERLAEKCTLDEDDDFFNIPGVMEALDRLEKVAYLKFSMPSFDLDIEFSMTQPSQNEKNSTNENPVAQMTEDPIMKIARNIEEENNKEEMVEIVEGGVREAEYRNQEDVVTEEQENVEEELKMTAPVAKRQKLKNASKAADTEWKFRSPYLKHNHRLCKEMRKEEKLVIDYAFSKEVGNELLYNDDSSLFLNHEEFQTLEDEKEVDNSVIDAWVKLLNDREHKNNPPKRALILSTLVYVLFPVHRSQHYYIYCFYTNKNVVDVIDNRILEDGLEFKDKYEESFNQLGECIS
ncbi:unnamed protein product [Cuscuta europaea]|uniref:Ubiquitin-like protease family profile domain-containing protein n=1 Tax=Cuscuta europaea TaxID=41803 RepID=A0A9P1A0P1_CUSEU|nr:unnamed protein product [Cuscuta europaea]